MKECILNGNAILLYNSSHLILSNFQFNCNTSKKTVIVLDKNSKLEIISCKFNGNKSENPPSCISSEAINTEVIIRDSEFVKHGDFGSPYENSDSIITSIGILKIINSHFEHNLCHGSENKNLIGTGVIN